MSLHAQYARPRTATQAAELLDSLGAGAMVIAGGQEMMPHVNHGKLMPSVLIDIGALAELRGIKEDEGSISIGALTVHRELQRDPLIRQKLPLLAHAAAQVGGGWQVQNRGTVGGNLVAMHPLYDLMPSLLALGAEVEILNAKGMRRESLAALILDTKHGLGTSSMLTRLRIAPMRAAAGWAYHKLKITEGSYGSANAAAIASVDGVKLSALNVVIGAVAERPIDASRALQALLGKPFDERAREQVESVCAALVQQPLADQQGDGAWRRAMAGVLARRAVTDALAKANKR